MREKEKYFHGNSNKSAAQRFIEKQKEKPHMSFIFLINHIKLFVGKRFFHNRGNRRYVGREGVLVKVNFRFCIHFKDSLTNFTD